MACDLVALVTGASSGIGRALAAELLDRGLLAAVTARDAARLVDLADRGALPVALELADPAGPAAAVAAVEAWAGRLDLLVANAGFGLIGPAAELDLDELRRQLEVNVSAQIALVQAAVPGMVRRGFGRIVLVGSVSGITTTPFAGAYCASKAALHALADALRMELAPLGVRVTLVQPGAVASRFAASSLAGLERYRRPESLYRPVADMVEARARLSEDRPTAAAEVARRVADAVLRPRPPAVVRVGRGSTLLPLLGRLPATLRHRLLARRFGLERLRG